jgi:hypothetical protein
MKYVSRALCFTPPTPQRIRQNLHLFFSYKILACSFLVLHIHPTLADRYFMNGPLFTNTYSVSRKVEFFYVCCFVFSVRKFPDKS